MAGDRFGSLTVISCEYRSHTSPSRLGKNLAWARCVCDCGKEREVPVNDLRTGKITSCRCRKTHPKWPRGKARSHGGWINGRAEPLYGIWASMKLRCSGGVKKAVKYYSAKGIKVCAEWLDYAVFREWAMSHGYKPGLTIERKDSDLNYEPGNCEWITRGENARRANAKRLAREEWMVREILRLSRRIEELEKLGRGALE
jgi:hypothetical protein